MQRTIARWTIDHDPDATRECYAQLSAGVGCSCSECRNFDAATDQRFPAEFITLAEGLGIDPGKPAELTHWCREPSGLFLIGGWFHFVGSIVSGADCVQRINNNGTFSFEQLTPEFEFGLTAQLALVRNVFTGLPIVQVEFLTRIPWVLAEAEPCYS